MTTGSGKRYNPQGDIGVNAVEAAVQSLGWIYRRQNEADVGIDGQIEIVDDDGVPTGRIIAVQVKSGTSFFREANDERVIFRSDLTHVKYWRNHALPVIVALHDPDSGDIIWQAINESTISPTDASELHFRIDVPRLQLLGPSSWEALLQLTEGSTRDRKLATLAASRALISAAIDGKVIVEVDEWINKSSGRGDFTISRVDNGEETVIEHFMIFAGSTRYEEVLQRMFPWAEVSIDEEHYSNFDDDDPDIANLIRFGEPEEIEAHRESLPSIRPYTNVIGEVDKYRLVLEPNDIARAFIRLDDYLTVED